MDMGRPGRYEGDSTTLAMSRIAWRSPLVIFIILSFLMCVVAGS